MHYPIQPRESVAPRSGPVLLVRAQVRQEIQSFLHALDSYPARVAKEPGVNFQEHLRSLFVSDNRRHTRSRRQ